MDEKEIIQQCLQGNTNAFAQMVNHYQYRVIAVAANITGDPEEARDVAQDVFVQAYQNLNAFDPNRSFKNWLMGITVKRSIDRLRKFNSFNRFVGKYKKTIPMIQNPKTGLVENTLLIQTLMKNLKGKERSILTLRLKEDISARDLGHIFNCSENTIRVHLFKARQKIKKALENNPGFLEKSEVEK